MAGRGLGSRQLAVLAALDEEEAGLSARELAQEIFGGDDAWNYQPLESEIRSAYRAARRLENRGLVVGRWVSVRHYGDELVFGLPTSSALGFGGDRSHRTRRIVPPRTNSRPD